MGEHHMPKTRDSLGIWRRMQYTKGSGQSEEDTAIAEATS